MTIEKQKIKKKKDKKKFSETMDQKNERRKMKGKALEAKIKLPEQFANLTEAETPKHTGVFSLRFGSCSNIRNLDVIGKSDPYAKIYFCDCEGNKVHYFKTYTIQESLNPIWYQEDISVHYFPGMVLLIKIYDEDPGRDELEGIVKVSLADLFSHTTAGADFKEVNFPLTADDKNLRSNSAAQLINPYGIAKANVTGTCKFQFAYISDEILHNKGMDKMEQQI